MQMVAQAAQAAGGHLFGNALQDLLASEFRGWHAPIPAIVAALGERAQRCNLLCETVVFFFLRDLFSFLWLLL
jgi:hypothetical protein